MSTQSPTAPGSLTTPVEPTAMLRYLEALGDWLRARRAELDDLDAQVLRSTERARLTSDVALSMALWQSVHDRHELLLATWDSGRVGPGERQRLAALVWGRLETAADPATASGAALEVSLPEACRLSDALVGQLRSRLSMDPALDPQQQRVRALRAQLERIRDQVALEPVELRPRAAGELDELGTRVGAAAEKAGRGADVGGLLGPLEHDAATLERDLIVTAARRRRTRDQRGRAEELRTDLGERAVALQQLVRRTVEEVDPAPRYAVPDVTVLGPVPGTGDELGAYLARLEQVGQAMQVVQHAYSGALARLEDARGRLGGYRAKTDALGLADHPVVGSVTAAAERTLAHRPAPVALAETLLGALAEAIRWSGPPPTAPAPAAPAAGDRHQEEGAR